MWRDFVLGPPELQLRSGRVEKPCLARKCRCVHPSPTILRILWLLRWLFVLFLFRRSHSRTNRGAGTLRPDFIFYNIFNFLFKTFMTFLLLIGHCHLILFLFLTPCFNLFILLAFMVDLKHFIYNKLFKPLLLFGHTFFNALTQNLQ